MPTAVLRLAALRELYLAGNRLEQVPSELFVQLSCLQHLDVRNNRLVRLPPSVGRAVRLETLLLGGNVLSALPVELSQCSALRGLQLDGNSIYFPPSEVVQGGVGAILSFLRQHAPPPEDKASISSPSLFVTQGHRSMGTSPPPLPLDSDGAV